MPNFHIRNCSKEIIENCDQTKCQGKYKIKPAINEEGKVKIGEVDLMLLDYPETVTIGVVRRVKRSIYCYDGGFLYSNTGYDEITVDLTPSDDEARRWMKLDM